MARPDTGLILEASRNQMMLPHEVAGVTEDLRRQKMSNALMQTQAEDAMAARESKKKLNALYQASGGDFDKMMQSGQLDMDTAMQLSTMQGEQAKLQGQAAKEQALADKARIQSGIEELNYGAQLLQGANPANWGDVRAKFVQMTGRDLGEQFDPAKVQSLIQQGLSVKDRLANEWKSKGYDLDVARFGEQRRHNVVQEGIGAINAQNRGDGGGQKAPSGYRYSDDGSSLVPIPGGPADIKVQAQQQKTAAAQQKNIAAIDNADASASQTLSLIDMIAKHPGKESAVGGSSILNVAAVPGSDRTDFLTKLDQLKGQQFLQAFESLKGGGAITEVEGKKAEQAIANLSTAQSEQQFDAALKDFRDVISAAQGKVRNRKSQYESLSNNTFAAPTIQGESAPDDFSSLWN